MSTYDYSTPPTLSEYVREGEPTQRQRSEVWQAAIGLQQVDRLTPSEYLIATARRHIAGSITITEAKQLIDTYYEASASRSTEAHDRTEEADKVAARIAELISQPAFAFTPAQLTAIHRHLFAGIYSHAGCIRTYNITKAEWVLAGKSVFYASADTISDTLAYDLHTERHHSYAGMDTDSTLRHLARFTANLWQIHPFGEGNTRTTAVFLIKYLRTLGFHAANDTFAAHSWYFRNALVRANYTDLTKGITETTLPLELFFRNLLLGEHHDLSNRRLHVEWKEDNTTATSPTPPTVA